MYENTGNKIKGFAKFCAFCDIALCVIVSIVFFCGASVTSGDRSAWFLFGALVVGVVGIILSWLKYLFLAGYGELIEETAKSSAYLEQITYVLRDTHSKENSGNKSVELQKTGCSYCGRNSDPLIGDLCSDCSDLYKAGIIVKCPSCNRYNYREHNCKCKFL